MSFTDEELDRNWQPNGRRPQSTIARNFQLELEDIFNLDETKAELQQSYDTRKYNVAKTNEELATLEARLREMEQRLNAVLPADAQKQPADDSTPKQEASSLSAAPTDDSKSRSRPGTARPTQQAPGSGDMPPTPGASEGEYYVVTRADIMDDAPR
ncbi:hypothetical protein MKX07_000136 [Trichoderma sp. CBMAI-0711]|uniref:Predicted protein n=3 Tax=Trichoderma TaxID=5543 RepID=G0RJF7_HYPJQ|nr:uncharacterized protein TRIREDRAFT_3918 [Trichoderma reesei QM6a]EGR48747.1 predicted protein [Trichoderma reesei QM6a]ETS01482.1 hypothetical protein M419DRAFT_80650 [Trichoderma reesei RUT C-30]KAK1242150.1 hypothetical protein MKX07_000136 [Trichoderma sp. CBMAI-0711]OTA07076.1 hypothetical protein A9Z42_0079290 [Trichoderma parareesei]